MPNNNYLVRKIGTNNKQLLHGMRKRLFTSRQLTTDIRITPESEWSPDPEVSLKHDDLYARAWEREYEKPIFEAKNNNATQPNSLEIPIHSDLSTEETWNTPVTAQKCSREIFPQREQLCDVTDTYPYMELDVETSSEQPNNSPNPAVPNTICVITWNLIAMKITDINSCAALVCSTEGVRRRSRKSGNASRNKYVVVQKSCYVQFWFQRGH